MKKILAIVSLVIFFSANAFALPPNKYNFLIAPGTLSENSVAILWDKQYTLTDLQYQVILNGKVYATTIKTNCILRDLAPIH